MRSVSPVTSAAFTRAGAMTDASLDRTTTVNRKISISQPNKASASHIWSASISVSWSGPSMRSRRVRMKPVTNPTATPALPQTPMLARKRRSHANGPWYVSTSVVDPEESRGTADHLTASSANNRHRAGDLVGWRSTQETRDIDVQGGHELL